MVDIQERFVGKSGPRGLIACSGEDIFRTVIRRAIPPDFRTGSRDDGIERVVGRVIRFVILPFRGIEINFPNQHSACGQASIPSHLLAVFDKIAPSGGGRSLLGTGSVDLVSLVVILSIWIEREVRAGITQVNRGMPSEEIFLPRAVVRRAMSIAAIRTTIHHIPVVRGEALTVVRAIAGVIPVRQTQHMTELMAKSSDTVERIGIMIQFCGDSVILYGLAAHFALRGSIGAVARGTRRRDFPVMRPNGG